MTQVGTGVQFTSVLWVCSDTWSQIAAQSHNQEKTEDRMEYLAQGEVYSAIMYFVQQKKTDVGQAWCYSAEYGVCEETHSLGRTVGLL